MTNSAKSKSRRFIVKMDEDNIKYPYILVDQKFDHIISNFKFEDDARELCRFQNRHCTFGNFEFPKFMRRYNT